MDYLEFVALLTQRVTAAFTTFRDGCIAAPSGISINNTELLEDPDWPNDLSFIVHVWNGNGGARRHVFGRIVLADAHALGFPDLHGMAGVLLTVHNWRSAAQRPPIGATPFDTGYFQGNFPQDLVSYDSEEGLATLEAKLTQAESAIGTGVSSARNYLRA